MGNTETMFRGDTPGTSPLLLTTAEAAQALRISRSRLYEMLARNEIPGVVRIGRCVRIRRQSLEAWVNSQVDGELK